MLFETDVAGDIFTAENSTTSKQPKAPKQLAFEEIIKHNTLPVSRGQRSLQLDGTD